MRLPALAFATALVAVGCDDAKETVKSLDDDRKALVDEVGGAPKRQLDEVRATVGELEQNLDATAKAANAQLDDGAAPASP